jgi:predicted Zn-dependent protease
MTLEGFAEAALRSSEADETEVVAIQQDESLTRFANNFIHQNVSERGWRWVIRAAVGGRVGVGVSNDATKESAARLTARACENARLQPENPDFRGFPKSSIIPTVQGFDEETANCPPVERARRVGVICRAAAAAGYVAAGSMTTGTAETLVANSHGVLARYRSSIVDGSTVVMSASSSGWAQSSGWRLDAVDWESMASEAIHKTRLGENPVAIEPGTYRVILDPYATADLLEMLAEGISGLAFQEERSWLSGRIGQKVMAESVSIVDNALESSGIPMPFDYEGVPRRPVIIVERGVARSPVHDTMSGGRMGQSSTGHATLPSATERPGPASANLFLARGPSNVDAMIRSTAYGLYITRFWYTRMVHPRDVVVTGMTRDGTFVVRDGAIVGAAKSMRFTQSYLETLNSTEEIGNPVKVLRSGASALVTPAVRLGQFRFTSATR